MQKNDSKLCRGGPLKPKQKPVKVDEKDTIENRKSKLQCYIEDNEGVMNDFKRFLRGKYGFVNGIYGKELLEAVSCYLTLNQFEHYRHRSLDILRDGGPAHKKLKSKPEILLEYLEKEFKESDVIKFKQIQDIILREFGNTDRRTHKSYVNALIAVAFLLQPDGVKDYDYYFFKEMPKPREGRPAFVVDVQTRLVFPGNKIYPLIPENGKSITIDKIRKLSTLKEADIQTGLKQLTNSKLINSPIIGHFKRVIEGIEV